MHECMAGGSVAAAAGLQEAAFLGRVWKVLGLSSEGGVGQALGLCRVTAWLVGHTLVIYCS